MHNYKLECARRRQIDPVVHHERGSVSLAMLKDCSRSQEVTHAEQLVITYWNQCKTVTWLRYRCQ